MMLSNLEANRLKLFAAFFHFFLAWQLLCVAVRYGGGGGHESLAQTCFLLYSYLVVWLIFFLIIMLLFLEGGMFNLCLPTNMIPWHPWPCPLLSYILFIYFLSLYWIIWHLGYVLLKTYISKNYHLLHKMKKHGPILVWQCFVQRG